MRILRDIGYWFLDMSKEIEDQHPLNDRLDSLQETNKLLDRDIEKLQAENTRIWTEFLRLRNHVARMDTDLNTLMAREANK